MKKRQALKHILAQFVLGFAEGLAESIEDDKVFYSILGGVEKSNMELALHMKKVRFKAKLPKEEFEKIFRHDTGPHPYEVHPYSVN